MKLEGFGADSEATHDEDGDQEADILEQLQNGVISPTSLSNGHRG